MAAPKLSVITFDDVVYYIGDELMNFAKVFFQGCINSRQVVAKRKLPVGSYIYAREDKNKDWDIVAGTSRKFDKLLIMREWARKNIPEFNGGAYDIKLAPSIIELRKAEKFKDVDGDIIEIEVRGEREYNKCYFNVKDVSDGFNLPSLYRNIIDKDSSYHEGIHYKYFNCILANKKVKKCLFLTFFGFMRTLYTSRSRKNQQLIATVYHWANQFSCTEHSDFTIDVPAHIRLSKAGITYAVSSPLLGAIKLGYWTGSIPGFMKRYITPYGKDLQVFYVFSSDAKQLETKIFEKFADQWIINELFEKSHWDEYVEFLKQHMNE
jgi:hypothetical protein